MATKITSSDTMEQAAGKINAAFAAFDANESFEQVGSSDSMSSIAGKVSRNFALVTDDSGIEDIAAADTMEDIADKLDADFAIAEDGSGGGDESPTIYTFAHCSDPHGSTYGGSSGFEEIVSLLSSDNNMAFGIVTGDMRAYGYAVPKADYKLAMAQKNGRMLAVPGNHDTIDAWESSGENSDVLDQRRMTNWLYDALGDNVNWGDKLNGQNVPDAGSYWYKDFGKLRVIGLDQYCYDQVAESEGYTKKTSHPGAEYILYSHAEMEWLADLLANTDSSYHVIIAFHDAPNGFYKPSWIYNDGEWNDEALFYRYLSASSFSSQGSGFGGGTWIQQMVKAWQNRQSATISQTKKMPTSSGDVNYTASVEVDFSEMVGNGNFVCYLCGHQHVDFGYWLDKENYPGQLVLLITAANVYSGFGNNCDLNIQTASDGTFKMADATEPKYRYNKVTYDTTNRTVLVERFGQKLAVNRDTLGDNYTIVEGTTKTRVRDKLLFNLDTMAVTHPQDLSVTAVVE